MAEEITIEQRAAQTVVEVAAETRLWRIAKVLESGFGTARAHIEASGAEVEGMPFARYLAIDWDKQMNQGGFAQLVEFAVGKIRMRTGLFCSALLESDGEAIATEIPAGRYVVTIHRGAYHKVGETYRRVWQWAGENEVKLATIQSRTISMILKAWRLRRSGHGSGSPLRIERTALGAWFHWLMRFAG